MRKVWTFLCFTGLFSLVMQGNLMAGSGTDEHTDAGKPAPYDAPKAILHHIANANEFHIVGNLSFPLPCILYDTKTGKLDIFLSSRFEHGHKAVNGYVLDHGSVKKVQDNFPEGEVEVHWKHVVTDTSDAYLVEHDGAYHEAAYAGFIDFSITKIVFGMLVASLFIVFLFVTIARGYRKREGQAPKGIQSLLEPLVLFIRDDIARPNIGHKYERYMPFLLTVFFFIWINNMIGLVPFFPGSANVTGNLMVTFSLAVFTLLVTVFSGNKHYWKHIFWMPGMPVLVKLLLAPIEIVGIFTKPFALMVRLFANITAGHIIILSLVSLIFIFGEVGNNLGGGIAGIAIAAPFMLFMNVLELLVAFLQAFIFTILSALFIGQAVEEHHEHH